MQTAKGKIKILTHHKVFDLQTIADMLEIPVRKVRYVVDHRVMPGFENVGKGQRVTRTFEPFSAFGVAISALLLDAGLRRSAVIDVIDRLAGPDAGKDDRDRPLFQAQFAEGSTWLEVGDGEHVRIIEDEAPSKKNTRRIKPAIDTKWLSTRKNLKVVDGYQPLICVRLHLSRVRDALGVDKP